MLTYLYFYGVKRIQIKRYMSITSKYFLSQYQIWLNIEIKRIRLNNGNRKSIISFEYWKKT